MFVNTDGNFREVNKQLKDALEVEKENLEKLRRKVRDLEVIELGYRQCYAIAPVATDGGENNLSLEPINIEIVRVVDSDGNVHFQDFLPLTVDPEELGDKLFKKVPILCQLCNSLGISDWRELSYLHIKTHEQSDPDVAEAISDVRRFIKTLRDLLEWATLVELAQKSGRPKFLLIRDGLLRTKFLKRHIVPKLAQFFKYAYNKFGAMIVGVAKRSKTLNYLSLALVLEGVFNRDAPCFVEVPEEIEREVHRFDRTWVMSDENLEQPSQSFGRLHLVKLVEGRDSLVLPVDIPPWLIKNRKEVLEYLAETAKASFPTLGYPYPLIRAHENANLSGLEMSLLEDLMRKALLDLVDDKDRERLLRHITLTRAIVKGGLRRG
jgi:hypothetical protein